MATLVICFDAEVGADLSLYGTLQSGVGRASASVVVPAIGACSVTPDYEQVWLVGEEARYPPQGWERVALSHGDLVSISGPRLKPDQGPDIGVNKKVKLAAGLVLALVEHLRTEILRLDSVDVVFVSQDSESTPPPWLELTLRRLRLSGRLQVATREQLEAGELFRESEEGRGWTSLLDRRCPADVRIVTLDDTERPEAWRAILRGAPIPARASKVLETPLNAQHLIFDIALDPMGELPSRRLENSLREEQIGPFGPPGSRLVLVVVRQSTERPKPFGGVWRTFTLPSAVRSKANSINGVTQVLEINRFGVATLSLVDDYDRPLPCEDGNERALLGLDLGNVLYPHIDRRYPVDLAQISYNGGPVDVTSAELVDDTRSLADFQLPPMRALRDALVSAYRVLTDVQDIVDRGGDREDILDAIPSHSPLLLDIRRRIDAAPQTPKGLEEVKGHLRKALELETASGLRSLLFDLAQVLPPDLPDFRAGLTSIDAGAVIEAAQGVIRSDGAG